jgi:hypothetical protein
LPGLFLFLGIASGLLSFTPAHAVDDTCPWVATVGQSLESIQAAIEKKSGKKPTVSCGGGDEFKVCHSCVDRLTDEQWAKIQEMLGDPNFNNWHTSWHNEIFDASKANAAAAGLSPEEFEGESFFFMHRNMIRNVNANAAALGFPCMLPWNEVPAVDSDPVWPTYDYVLAAETRKKCEALDPGGVKQGKIKQYQEEYRTATRQIDLETNQKWDELANDATLTSDERWAKQDELQSDSDRQKSVIKRQLLEKYGLTIQDMKDLDRCVRNQDGFNSSSRERVRNSALSDADPAKLKSESMGRAGENINFDWHGSLHGIYNTIQDPKCRDDISPIYCSYMGSPTTSHKNIYFYKVHGLIDTYIDRWLKANGYEMADTDCTGKEKCYQWKATYLSQVPDFVKGTGCTIGAVTPAAPASVLGIERTLKKLGEEPSSIR